ncbi:hypothetical protein Mapa_017072 [Marchantia paleacea]|nr:hypothetical protein Mapa_017072 [Marchantia paleacea]
MAATSWNNFSMMHSEGAKFSYAERVEAETVKLSTNAEIKDHTNPRMYASEVHRPTPKNSNIPIIDLSKASADTEATCKELGDAAVQWGIFQVVNHAISLEIMQEIENQGLEFFHSPLEHKLGCGDVYLPVGLEHDKSSFGGVERIVLTQGPHFHDRVGNIKCIDDILLRIWPKGKSQLRRAFHTYQRGLEAINRQILRLLARYLGVEEEFFSRHFEHYKSSFYALRWNFYPKFSISSERFGAQDHTDPFMMTILMQDKVGGLQVCRDGRWYGVGPVEGALVVNMGDSFYAWTNCRLKSPCHNVVSNDEIGRLSLVAFVSPDPATLLAPPDELIDENHPRIFKTFSCKDLLKKRGEVAPDAALVDGRIGYLDCFKIHV